MEETKVIQEAIDLLQGMLDHHPNLVLYNEAVKLYRAVPALIAVLAMGKDLEDNALFVALSEALTRKSAHEGH